jgi:hypothetical protein
MNIMNLLKWKWKCLRERDKFIAAAGEGSGPLPAAATEKLTPMLRKLIGEVNLKDFSLSEANPQIYIGTGMECQLDGLNHAGIVVSTIPLLRAWLRTSWWHKPVPANLKAIFESGDFYTFVSEVGAVTWQHGLSLSRKRARGGNHP